MLIAVLLLETIGGAWLLISMIPTFPEPGPERAQLIPLWFSLFVSAVLWWVWIGATLVGALRRRGNWVRASAITSNVLLFAAGVGVVQGIFSTPAVGVGLIVLSVAGFVSAALMRSGGANPAPESDAEV